MYGKPTRETIERIIGKKIKARGKKYPAGNIG